jgi:dTDP-4-amino-4,6-dideoxygalactose transaminase
MARIHAIASKHHLLVVEDACQAWLAELNGKKCGTFGDLGCFSFQNSKHLTCGEGGAIVGADDALMERVFSFHNVGRGGPYLGWKCRMAEYQAAILLAQMDRLEEQTQRRWENATYLTSKIQGIPGVTPHRLYAGVTRAAYHLYPFRYKPEAFNGVPRDRFIAALRAEGIPASSGYRRQNVAPFVENTLSSRRFQRMYSKQQLDHCRQQIACPANDAICREAVWFSQQLLLGSKADMDEIANALVKLYENRDQLT